MARLRKIRMRKRFQRRRFGRASRGAGNPKQIGAAVMRRRVRRSR